MDEVLISLLERVRDGQLSESEAERRYQRFIADLTPQIDSVDDSDGAGADIVADTNIGVSADISSDVSSGISSDISTEEDATYSYRRIENIQPSKQATCRLFVFLPFGFGNETASFSWRLGLEDEKALDVWFIGASNHNSWSALVDYLVEKVASLCDIPFIVYGHSMGAIVAYEVLVALQVRYQLSPRVFLPSSVPSPKSFARLKYVSPFYNIDNTTPEKKVRDILETSQIILSKASGILPVTDTALNCDIALVKSYCSNGVEEALGAENSESEGNARSLNVIGSTDDIDKKQIKLICPIYALQANNDILVKDATVIETWRQYTHGDFNFREVEGTHLYFLSPPRSLFSLLKEYVEANNKTKDKTQAPNVKTAEQTFLPKVYKLVSFEAGTEEVSTFPYGITPQGYLIYQPDGHMAAHIWNPARHVDDAFLNRPSEAEKFFSYLSYTGRYRTESGLIEHDISASTDPNFEGDKVTRYWQSMEDGIVLNTAPLTIAGGVQSKSSAYCALRWTSIPSACDHASGSSYISDKSDVSKVINVSKTWCITACRKGGGEKQDVKGHMIFTDSGLFSLVASACSRTRFHYDNHLLASDDEIHHAVSSVVSVCGRYKHGGRNRYSVFLNVDIDMSSDRVMTIQLRWWRNKSILAVRIKRDDAKNNSYDVYICECA